MKRLLFFLGIVLFVIVWGQVSWGAKELTFSIPPGWIPSQPASPEQKLHALLIDERGVARAELIFAVEPIQPNLDLEGYFKALSQSLQNFFQSYTPQETTPFEASGLSGLRHKFLFRVQGNPNELQGLAFLFLLEGQVYTLSFDCLTADFPQLESQFVQIARGVTVAGETPATPPTIATTPFEGLPPIGGGTAEPISWVYQDAQNTFKIPLPQGTSISQELDNGAIYATPNEGQVVILKLESEAAVQGIIAQAVQGKNFHGTAQLNTLTGSPAQIALYSSTNPDTGIQYATLVGMFPGKTLLVLVILPVAEYEKARSWIEALFTQTEVR